MSRNFSKGSGMRTKKDERTTPQGSQKVASNPKKVEDPDAKQHDEKSSQEVQKGGDVDKIFLKNVPNANIAVHFGRYASYMAHAARLLRCHEKIELSGLGTAIRTVIEISEALKRQKLGQVSKIVTERFRPSQDDPQQKQHFYNRNRSSVPKMTVTLSRGKWGLLLSGYQQKRIVSIFEKKDAKMSGRLNLSQIKELELPKVFYVDPHRPKSASLAEEFLKNKSSLNLPEFIEYSSILVSPLLMRKAFDDACDSIVGKFEDDTAETPSGVTSGGKSHE